MTLHVVMTADARYLCRQRESAVITPFNVIRSHPLS